MVIGRTCIIVEACAPFGGTIIFAMPLHLAIFVLWREIRSTIGLRKSMFMIHNFNHSMTICNILRLWWAWIDWLQLRFLRLKYAEHDLGKLLMPWHGIKNGLCLRNLRVTVIPKLTPITEKCILHIKCIIRPIVSFNLHMRHVGVFREFYDSIRLIYCCRHHAINLNFRNDIPQWMWFYSDFSTSLFLPYPHTIYWTLSLIACICGIWSSLTCWKTFFLCGSLPTSKIPSTSEVGGLFWFGYG